MPPEEVIQAVLRAIRKGAHSEIAAAACGVSIRTWQEWRQKGRNGVEPYASLETQIERAEAKAELGYVARIKLKSARDWKADAWLLERSRPQRWGKAAPEPEIDDDEEIASDLWDEAD